MNKRMSFSEARQPQLERIGDARLRAAAAQCLAIGDKFAQQRDLLERDSHLSDVGRRAKITDAVRVHARDLRDARKPILEAQQNLDRLRGQIKPVAIDRTDVVAAMERQEIRAFIRGLSSQDKISALLKNNDPKILDAVLDAPAALSGIEEQHYAAALAARKEQLHGPALMEIEQLKTVIDEANAVAQTARRDLMSTSDLQPDEFEKIVAPIETRRHAPWIVKMGDDQPIIRVRPEKSGTDELHQPATPDEIRDGKFFKNEAEYLAERAA
jgi:hypothetical protein